MQSPKEKLAKGAIIYMVGNLLSKLLQMLILPIVTGTLLTSEYGNYELIITTISLFTPIITFQIIEGMFRYMFNTSEEEQKKTITTVSLFLLSGSFILGGIIILTKFVIPTIRYPVLIYLNYISSILLNFLQKIARCKQKNIEFAISGAINTAVMLICQVVTLLILRMHVDGMLIANSISYFTASIYILVHLKISDQINIHYFDKGILKKLLIYSIPLIPNSIGWWLIASSDRYIIAYFIGASANGVYSIAGKFSQLLTFVTSVFQLAWQESAIMEENNEKRDLFYSSTFNTYMRLLLCGCLIILPLIKILFPILVSKSYQIGYLYNPILLCGAIMSAFSQFYGSIYLVLKKTHGIFLTTVVGAIINIVIGVTLVTRIGLFAPALGTFFSFGMQWILRANQMKGYFKINIDLKDLLFLILMLGITTVGYYMSNIYIQFLLLIFGIAIFFKMNWNLLNLIVLRIKKIIGK